MDRYKISGFYKKTLLGITPSQLMGYLRGKGAKKAGGAYQGKAEIWKFGKTELIVPLAKVFADYATRIAEALHTLGKIERRDQAQILADMMACPKSACRDCGGAVLKPRDFYCPVCIKQHRRENWKKHSRERASRAVAAKTQEPGPSRVCHDCGAPTTDYRCPKCRAAWRKKHCVPGYTIDDLGLQ